MKLLRYEFDIRKKIDKGLEKIAKEGRFLRTIKKIGGMCTGVLYINNLVKFYSISKKLSNLPNRY